MRNRVGGLMIRSVERPLLPVKQEYCPTHTQNLHIHPSADKTTDTECVCVCVFADYQRTNHGMLFLSSIFHHNLPPPPPCPSPCLLLTFLPQFLFFLFPPDLSFVCRSSLISLHKLNLLLFHFLSFSLHLPHPILHLRPTHTPYVPDPPDSEQLLNPIDLPL